MLFDDKDFDGLTYQVHKKPKSKIGRLSVLAGMDLLTDDEAAYLVYMYDLNSPFWQISDVETRKAFAAEKAGFNVNDNKVEALLHLERPGMRTALVSLLRDQRNMEYSAMVNLEYLFYEYTSRLLEPLDSDDQNTLLKGLEIKGKLKEQLGQIIEQYKAMKASVFGANPDKNAIDIVERFTPENVAKTQKRKV
jgi:hypothetical protein